MWAFDGNVGVWNRCGIQRSQCLFVLELCMMTSIAGSKNSKIQTRNERITSQSPDLDWRTASWSFGRSNTRSNVDSDGVLPRVFEIDGASQGLVPGSVRTLSLHLSHYSLLAGHPGEHCIYDSIRKKLYGPHMTIDVYATVGDHYSHS